ncbi:MAG: hypothetical protein NT167_22820 [Verrucomicrobia bacterium]|nr:hypothetical protein [Verrucomicrobiota bacterium]
MTVARAIELFRLFLLASRDKRRAIERILRGADEVVAKPSGGTRVEKIFVRGKLGYRPGFDDVWVEDTPYDLRERIKARLCLQYLVEMKAFDASSARSLVDEIDPYVREKGNFPRSATIKIDDYFNDRAGRLQVLRRELIASVRGDGRYFLKVD